MIDELRKFVLDKNASGLDKKKFKICMYITKSNLHKLNGLASVMQIENNTFSIISEISTFPLGFILYFNPTEDMSAINAANLENITDKYGEIILYSNNSTTTIAAVTISIAIRHPQWIGVS